MRSAYLVSDIQITSPENPRAWLFAAFLHTLSRTSNITHLFLLGDIFDLRVADYRYFVVGSWLDAPCYFKLDDTDERFYELTEENVPQPLECLSAVK